MPTDIYYKKGKLESDMQELIKPAVDAYTANEDALWQTSLKTPPTIELQKSPTDTQRVASEAPQIVGKSQAATLRITIKGLPNDFSRDLLVDALNDRFKSNLSKDDFVEGDIKKYHNGFEGRDISISLDKFLAAKAMQVGRTVGTP